MMDNTGDGSEFDVSLPLILPTSGNDSGFLARPRVLLQGFGGPKLGNLGGYVSLAASAAVGAGEDSTSGVGNLELGVLYRTTLSREVDLGIRVGFAAATATGGDAQQIGLATAILDRPADAITSLPGNWLRLGISPTFHSGVGFARIDLGLDTALTDRAQTGGGAYAHINVGVGFNEARFTAALEMQSLFQVGTDNGDTDVLGSKVFTGGVSARCYLDIVSPYAMLSLPFGNGLSGKTLNLTFGFTAPF